MPENCTSSIPSVRNFSHEVLWSLRITNSTIGLLNIFGNSLLIYALKKTGQTTAISLQLIVLMSISDVINGTVALFLTNIILWKQFDSDCYLKLTAQFLQRLFLGFSFQIVFVIALDRFLHIKYLQRYPIIVPKRRIRFLVGFIFLSHAMIAFVSSMPFLGVYMKIANLVYICVAAVGVITILVLYYKTTRLIRQRVSSMGSSFMQRTIIQIKTLVNVALSICICTLLLLTPYIIGVVILEVRSRHQAQNATEVAIFRWYANLATLANGVCSCAIFTLYNRPVKQFMIRTIMQKVSE